MIRQARAQQPPNVTLVHPGMPWGRVRAAAHGLLPGSRFRRRLLWRYTLVRDRTVRDETRQGGP